MINAESKLAQEFWEKGSLSHCPVLDFHAHMGSFYGGYIPDDTPEGMLKAMDKCNTILTCFCSHASLYAPNVGRDADLEIAKKYSSRFKAYHIVSSRQLEVEKDLKRVDDNIENYVGFKFLSDYYEVSLSDKRHEPYWEYADNHGLLTLCHTWGGSAYDGPDEAEKILSRYSNLVMVAGHSFHGRWDRAVELAKKYPNLYLELTAILDDRGALDLFVEKLGSEKILFGVDLPWFSYEHGIGAVLSAQISDEDRRNILYRNGQKLLSRFPWFKEIWDASGAEAL